MGCTYTGNVEHEVISAKGRFNWAALLIWICSLIISLVPIYLSAISYLVENNVIDINFLFNCFTKDDILWVFSTVLLFSLVNYYSPKFCSPATKRRSRNNLSLSLSIFGVAVFVFTEATWLVFKYVVKSFATWPIILGAIWVIIIMIISTPLQIDFIRNEE